MGANMYKTSERVIKMSKNTASKNIIMNVAYYCVTSIIGLVGRKIFCDYLSADIVGLNGLLTSIISMLSLAELGMGTAIGYQLYRPLAERDTQKVASIMQFFKKAYRILGGSILLLGIVLLPFLNIMIESDNIGIEYVYIIYFIFLFDAVISYFLSYRRVLLISDQREFEIKQTDIIVSIVTFILQCLVLLTTQNYVFYLLVRVVCILLGNVFIYTCVGKKYPYIKGKDILKISDEDKRLLINDVKALFVIKIAIYCVSGTDNLLLSSFVGLEAVAIFSNYSLIILTVTNLFGNIFSAIVANLGNYIISENSKNVYLLYKRVFFANFIIATYVAVSMVTIFNYFIRVWVGESYLWPIGIVVILVLNNYMSMIRKSTEAFRSAAGLFAPRPFWKYVTLLEGAINVGASIFLVKVFDLGVIGIFLGTSISTLISTIGVPWIVYKYLFHKPLKEYFGWFFRYFLSAIALVIISWFIMGILETSIQLVNVAIAIVISFCITILGISILYGKSEEYKYWKKKVLSRVGKR